MRIASFVIFAIVSSFGFGACADDVGPSGPTKEEAADRGGKSDDGGDFCEAFGWYDDCVCDGFCPAPDPDCGGTGRTCGTRGAPRCEDGEYCDYPASASCGAADRPGTCQERPTICTREFAPVCGCDGTTYSNACNARAAGTSVSHEGVCGTTATCEPQDARGVGLCQAVLGVKFDGSGCVTLSGCSCEGADCAALYTGPETCRAARDACL